MKEWASPGAIWELGKGAREGFPSGRIVCSRGGAESRSGGPALPFPLVTDVEAVGGEAAPGPHQPQPGRAEAAAVGEDQGPG